MGVPLFLAYFSIAVPLSTNCLRLNLRYPTIVHLQSFLPKLGYIHRIQIPLSWLLFLTLFAAATVFTLREVEVPYFYIVQLTFLFTRLTLKLPLTLLLVIYLTLSVHHFLGLFVFIAHRPSPRWIIMTSLT